MTPSTHEPRQERRQERLTYTMPEAAALLGVSERYLWKIAEQGILPLVRLGGRTLVRRSTLERVIAEREAQRQDAGRLRVMAEHIAARLPEGTAAS